MTQKMFRRLTVGLLTISATTIMAAPVAFSQIANPEEMIARADANEDGDISWDEVVAFRSGSFDQLDRNGDGVISADDSPARPFAGRFNEAFERVQANYDGDRDGQVTRDEMLNGPAPVFERGDVDGDGVLTADEMAAITPEFAAQ